MDTTRRIPGPHAPEVRARGRGDLASELSEAAGALEGAGPEEILSWAFARFDRVAVVASLQAESVVLMDMASRIRPQVDVITLDTGRLPQETHDLVDTVHRRLPVRLRVVSPDSAELGTMVDEHGVNLFLLSPELRRLCCDVRKARPLARALDGYGAWVTGLRREQSGSRASTPVVAADPARGGIAKVAPLATWNRERVRRYIEVHHLPQHALYRRGYTSIGCAPCTRATRPGEGERAGRWWWETDAVKECGLHAAHATPAGGSAAAPGAIP